MAYLDQSGLRRFWQGVKGKVLTLSAYGGSAAGIVKAADKVKNALTVKNSAGEQLASFNGSEAKELTLTKSAVGLGSVDNTADSAKKVLSASKATGSSFQLGSVNTNAKFFATNDSNLIFAYNTASYNHLYLGLYGSAGNALCPNGDSGLRLGTDGAKWSGIWAASGTINTSDAQQKKDIADLAGGAEFIYALRPVSFKFIDGESGRTHWGLTAQDVKETMDALGITDMDFAGWTRAPKTERTEDGGFREIPGEYEYGLRYAEFIAPLIAAVQSQKHEIDALRAEIGEIKNKEV